MPLGPVLLITEACEGEGQGHHLHTHNTSWLMSGGASFPALLPSGSTHRCPLIRASPIALRCLGEVQGPSSPSAVASKGQGQLSCFHDPVGSLPDGGGAASPPHLCHTPRQTSEEIGFSTLMPLEPVYPHPAYQGRLRCASRARHRACSPKCCG